MHFYFFLSHFILQYLILVYFRFFAFLFLLLSILNLLRYKYRLNINHAYLLSRHLLYCADHRMYNRICVIFEGACVCACLPRFFLAQVNGLCDDLISPQSTDAFYFLAPIV